MDACMLDHNLSVCMISLITYYFQGRSICFCGTHSYQCIVVHFSLGPTVSFSVSFILSNHLSVPIFHHYIDLSTVDFLKSPQQSDAFMPNHVIPNTSSTFYSWRWACIIVPCLHLLALCWDASELLVDEEGSSLCNDWHVASICLLEPLGHGSSLAYPKLFGPLYVHLLNLPSTPFSFTCALHNLSFLYAQARHSGLFHVWFGQSPLLLSSVLIFY